MGLSILTLIAARKYVKESLLGGGAVVGKNVTISQQVSVLQGPKGTHVDIGDNVILGAGCKIIGNVKIGSNCIIGANAVVTHDIPPNTVAAGVPARVIRKLD